MTGVRLEGQREAIAAGQTGVLRTCIEEVGVELDWKRKKRKTYEETVILSGLIDSGERNKGSINYAKTLLLISP